MTDKEVIEVFIKFAKDPGVTCYDEFCQPSGHQEADTEFLTKLDAFNGGKQYATSKAFWKMTRYFGVCEEVFDKLERPLT